MCWGYGRLVDPPSRASAWRFGWGTPIDYNDNEGFCGGFQVSDDGDEGGDDGGDEDGDDGGDGYGSSCCSGMMSLGFLFSLFILYVSFSKDLFIFLLL